MSDVAPPDGRIASCVTFTDHLFVWYGCCDCLALLLAKLNRLRGHI